MSLQDGSCPKITQLYTFVKIMPRILWPLFSACFFRIRGI